MSDQSTDTAQELTEEPPQAPRLEDAPRRATVILLLGLSLVALVARGELVMSEIQTLKSPTSALLCDINPLIGCSTSLLTWQAHLLFGIPNALVGVALFAGLVALFGSWLGGNPPRWMMLTLKAGLTAALLLIGFFLWQSLTVFRTLCPFCAIVWVCTILIWVHLGAQLMRLGWLLPGSRFAHFWVAQRWFVAIIILLLIVVVVAFALSDKLVYIF